MLANNQLRTYQMLKDTFAQLNTLQCKYYFVNIPKGSLPCIAYSLRTAYSENTPNTRQHLRLEQYTDGF